MARRRDPAELTDAALAGDRGAMARLISLVEEGGEPARTVGRSMFPLAGKAYTVGITGPPGAGKSTLTDRLIGRIRKDGDAVGVLAVDPTSPFSGGALLGDRVRMQDHATDPNVFIRSMATRGHLGGLALATREAIRVLDACGIPWVLVETVGVGQVEIEIAGTSDTTVVVLTPGAGDSVQANKAGLLEVADLFVINKSDRPGTQDLERDLAFMLHLSDRGDGAWQPPIVRAVASTGEGTDQVWEAILEHRRHLESDGRLVARRQERLRREVAAIVARRLERRAVDACQGAAYERLLGDVTGHLLDPWAAAAEIVESLAG
ncbi:MAG: putative metallochaperone MeaB [Acidimicrobiales bacterium]|nr:putative metallochaperone MeaB [Acidimicrobiales bacterium]